ncbi:MAG: dihydroorotate dehydrogenase [Clostridia bacterium]|nr:dihydroorotate dehydrogenase [Clostridia bacterium]
MLEVNLGGIQMKNPVTTASGTFGFGQEFAELFDLNRLGAITVKGTTLEPREGNPTPRMAETPAGMINAVGLQNKGVAGLQKEALPFLANYPDLPVIVNISANSPEEYAELAAILDQTPGISGLEVNISCPNVKKGGLQFGSDPHAAAEVTKAVRKATSLPVIVKLSPNVADIAAMAVAVENAGADAVSLINTLLGMVIDVQKRKPAIANIMGGLSGPAIRPVAVRSVWQVYKAIKIPILGMGGIVQAEDALQFILAGATAVAVGTANFLDPLTTIKIVQGIKEFMEQNGVKNIQELIGAAH